MNADSIVAMAAMAALNDMFSKGWISISKIDEIAKAMNVVPDRQARDTLSLLHCVPFASMPEDLRKEVPGLVRKALFNGSAAFEFAYESPRRDVRVLR